MKREISKNFPPPEILKYVNQKTDEVAKMNGEEFDKASFKLGMVCMWNYLKAKKLLTP